MQDLTNTSATELLAQMARGETSAAEIMAAHLDRIAALNPGLTAIVGLRPREALMAEARAADAVPLAERGALHGLPMAVKDLVAVKGVLSTWGSPVFANHIPERDELLAARLRRAGAILIGKTNTPEFGLGSHSYNPVHGVTGNPWNPGLSAGGSSGGAAAALAARLVPLADGSDMMGSLRNPAAWCNVYGFRPSWGLVPTEPGGDTYMNQVATDGPMARSIPDLALLLNVLAEPDLRHPHARPARDFTRDLTCDPKRIRLAWAGDWGGALPFEAGILELSEAALSRFAEAGATVTPVAPPFALDQLWQAWTTLRSWAVAMKLLPLYDNPETRAKLKPEVIWEVERGLPLSAAEVHRASVIRSAWYAALAGLLQDHDALVLPSTQVWPFETALDWPKEIAGQPMDSYHRWMEVVVPASLGGLPALAVPAGFSATGLPGGLQLIGKRGDDHRLLQIGQAWHEALPWADQVPG